ncbi:hypothetical protein FS837_008262 [Tulasnella sp. UAMH 9824]|nr:hypothetical protein FS837_008262 [Tulasnella sp. UAMH 9824]
MTQEAGSASSNPQTGNNYATNLRQKFGEIGNFWNRYNKLADDHDERLIKNLNDNLDVLLIFMTTPALSPDPSAEANYLLRLLITKLDNTTFPSVPEPPSQSKDLPSVRANCLLYSSLCCSILAAVGAMLAKEWLQNFEKGGQVGPVRDQVLRRQHKFNGVRHWQLEPMTRLLPTLLLTSVVLFGIGLIEYLVPIDDSVAWVVIAFAILGGIFYVFTTSAAAFWDACPYQTSVSKASKYVVETIVLPSIRHLGHWLLRSFGSHVSVPKLPTVKSIGDSDQDNEILSAQAACWLLETTSSPTDQQMAIQNLISLSPGVCSSLIHDWDTYKRMLSLTLHSIRAWQDKPSNKTVRPAQQFSAALLHLCVGCPRHAVEWTMVKENLAQVGIEAGEHRGERLSGCLELCLADSTTTLQASPTSIFPKNDYSMKVVTLSMIVLGDIPFWSLDRGLAWSALKHVFVDKYDDTILALLALAISKGFQTVNLQSEEKIRSSVRNACSGKDITAILLEGVRSGPTALSKEERPSYIHALPIFTEILRHLGELPSTKAFIGLDHEALFLDVTQLILAVDGIYDPAPSSEVLKVLDKFMDEAQRLLRKFKPPITRQAYSMDTIFNGTLVCFARCNQNNSSTSNATMQTLDWLNRCLGEYKFVTDDTVSRLMWGLESTSSREDVLQLIYTYLSKWGSRVGNHEYKSWVSKGLIKQLLKALAGGASTGSMNMLVPLTLRHIIRRAASESWEVQDSEEIMRVGINVVNSVNSDTGTTGQAYSLVIFEVVLIVWGLISEEIKGKQMSGEVVQATKRTLQVIEELISNQPPKTTLTDALSSEIGIMVYSEPFNLSPELLQKFLDDFASKKSDIWAIFGVDIIVNRLRGRLFKSNGTTSQAQI